MSLTFIIGGCRSGKSALALRLAEQLLIKGDEQKKGLYIATAVVNDLEMHQRVERHRAERGSCWDTFEWPMGGGDDVFMKEPFALCHTKGEKSFAMRYGVILFDCLTLWLSGHMETRRIAESSYPENLHIDLDNTCNKLVQSLKSLSCPVIMVSNEVGLGLVPDLPEGRLFRDLAGEANQCVAACADTVILSVSGLYLSLKGSMPQL